MKKLKELNKNQITNILAGLGLLILTILILTFVVFKNDTPSEDTQTPEVLTQTSANPTPAEQDSTYASTPGIGTSGPFPRYINGVPYTQTSEGITQYQPVYTSLIEGIKTEGNLAETVGENNVTPEVYALLKNTPDGSYKNSKITHMEQIVQEEYEPFRMTQTISFIDGSEITLKIGYKWDGKNPETGKWLVYHLALKPAEDSKN